MRLLTPERLLPGGHPEHLLRLLPDGLPERLLRVLPGGRSCDFTAYIFLQQLSSTTSSKSSRVVWLLQLAMVHPMLRAKDPSHCIDWNSYVSFYFYLNLYWSWTLAHAMFRSLYLWKYCSHICNFGIKMCLKLPNFLTTCPQLPKICHCRYPVWNSE